MLARRKDENCVYDDDFDVVPDDVLCDDADDQDCSEVSMDLSISLSPENVSDDTDELGGLSLDVPMESESDWLVFDVGEDTLSLVQ